MYRSKTSLKLKEFELQSIWQKGQTIHEWECSIRPGLAGVYIETTSPALILPTIPYLPKATSRPLPPFRTPQKTHCRHFPLSLAHITNATNSTKAYTSPLPSTQDPSLPNPTLPTLPTAQKVFTLPHCQLLLCPLSQQQSLQPPIPQHEYQSFHSSPHPCQNDC